LTNVARHSGSGTAKLTVESDADRLTLIVRDHGRGLPNGHMGSGNGIRGMRERADLIGAGLRIDTPIDGPGTELRLELPLNGDPCHA
jgi:two-component system sensor histidine kinase UhpB